MYTARRQYGRALICVQVDGFHVRGWCLEIHNARVIVEMAESDDVFVEKLEKALLTELVRRLMLCAYLPFGRWLWRG
jgi:hypothetical protein